MIFTRLVPSIFVLLLLCCNPRDENKLSIIEIDPASGKTIKLSEIVASFEFFQPNDKAIVAYISDLIVFEDKVIILDNQIKKEVQVFNLSGESLLTLQALGDGPGQFRSPSKLRVSSSGNELILYCALNKKFLIYNWDGDFIKEVLVKEIGLIGDFIEKDGELIFVNVMTVDKSKRLGKLDLVSYPKDKKLTFFENYPGDFFKIKADKNQYFFESQQKEYFFFKDIYSNTIVKMDWDGGYTSDKLEVSSNTLNLDVNKIYEPFDLIELSLQTDAYIFGEAVSVTKSDLIFDVSKGEIGVATLILNLNSKKVQVISMIENDLDGLFSYNSFASFGSHKAGIMVINFDHDLVYNRMIEVDLENHPFSQKFEKLKSPDNENPVLLIYSLK